MHLKKLLLISSLLAVVALTGCSGYVAVGSRSDGWCDCPDYRSRHKHDSWWYWDDYDRDGVINGHDDYPYDSWWW